MLFNRNRITCYNSNIIWLKLNKSSRSSSDLWLDMTSKDVTWKIINIILVLTISVLAKPTCRARFRTDLVCAAGSNDYTLQRGLVSDNNNTVAITLKDCRITGINVDAFHNIYNLEELDLSRNKIADLRIGVFGQLPKLISLRVSKNLLKTLPSGIFDNLTKLQRLDLSDNKIHRLPLGIFNQLPKLVRLELTANALLGKDLDPSLFSRNPKLTFLHFSGNNMAEAPDQLLNSIQQLSVLGLNNCSLIEVPKFATSPNLKTLKHLILQINKIKGLDDPVMFDNLESLISLDLIGNDINNLHENVFKPLTKLNIIDLSFNKLREIPENLFQNMVSVQNVDLSNNLLERVSVNAFRGTRLKKLKLNKNNISFLDNNFLLELKNSQTRLMEFYFNDNGFQCACLLEIINEVKKFRVAYNSDKYNGEEAVCFMTEQFTCMRPEFEYPMNVR